MKLHRRLFSSLGMFFPSRTIKAIKRRHGHYKTNGVIPNTHTYTVDERIEWD